MEIVQWIESNHVKSEDVVIIDDDRSLNDLPSHLKERLVLTNSYTGLSDVRSVKSVLKRRLGKDYTTSGVKQSIIIEKRSKSRSQKGY